MLFCGIDLHSNNCFIEIIDHEDKVIYSKRHLNVLEEISAVLKPYLTKLVGIVVESTFNWYWLVDGLQKEGQRVVLANTTAIKQYEGLKNSGDTITDSCDMHFCQSLDLAFSIVRLFMSNPSFFM